MGTTLPGLLLSVPYSYITSPHPFSTVPEPTTTHAADKVTALEDGDAAAPLCLADLHFM
jgi:hypothetical protein